MDVTVKYFGMIAEKIGKSEERISLSNFDGENFRAMFEQLYPEIKTINYKIAINQQLTDVFVEQDKIKEIALLPPFAGG